MIKLKVGDEVRRGPHWKYGNQDISVSESQKLYGKVVCFYKRHNKESYNVEVKWPNEVHDYYRYNDVFQDIEPVNTHSLSNCIKLIEDFLDKNT